jgi:site-specific DNA-cytosine methylase
MRLLELFCGTKSVGKVFEAHNYQVISLDYNPKFNATHTDDILTWNFHQYPSDHFDVIWASPDCTTWSLATGGKYRTKTSIYGLENEYQDRATSANQMILRVMEIIDYFQPKVWFIENPKALLVHYPPFKEWLEQKQAHTTVVYYGNYDDWGFIKPTHIWSNLPLWREERPELPENTYTLQYHNYDKKMKRYYKAFKKSAEHRSKIPPSLVERLRQIIP